MMDRDGSKMIGGWLGKLADGESIHLGRKLKMRKRYGQRMRGVSCNVEFSTYKKGF